MSRETLSALLDRLDVRLPGAGREPATIQSVDPSTGATLATLSPTTRAEYDETVARARDTFGAWRTTPAPARAELVQSLAALLRSYKSDLGALVSLEVGKIRSEGLGEVQEMIDVCDFAVGLSRQLHGLTIASERPEHRMFEQWHPLGPIGIVTAFNFPVAVWAWNAALAAVCGDTCIWKPSPLAPLTALAVQRLCERAQADVKAPNVFSLVLSGADGGAWMASDERLPLVSFTGSSAVGKQVAATVAGRLGRSLLELGGNNGVIVTADADLELATRAVTFGAVGTAGQRCTTTRRLFVERKIASAFIERLVRAYKSVKVGDPLEDGVLLGPLIRPRSIEAYHAALAAARAQGGEVICGGKALSRPGFFVEPTIVRCPSHAAARIAWQETFAPILYVFEFDTLDEAIAEHNAVPQGLSSAVFTDSVRTAERFLSATGSDCGIANVNLGTSGAEIGGAFGGEKETGGGRESGSDAWKAYMRRQTCTVNGGRTLPLAQGVKFEVQ